MMIPGRISALRNLMKREGVQAYLIPSTDPHQSEYIPECWQRRKWISGFTGSAGDVVVTTDRACLWTDGRYFLQAEEQLQGSGIDLFKMGKEGVPKLEEWVSSTLDEGERIGIDPKLLSMEGAKKLETSLKEKGVLLHYLAGNLVDEIWEDRPSPSKAPVEVLDHSMTGETVDEKLRRLREKMDKKGVRAHVLCALDTIAWTLNLRGKDVEYNPVFISYCIVTRDEAHLFVDLEKVTDRVRESLDGLVELHAYEGVEGFLKDLALGEGRMWVDPKTTNQWIKILLEGRRLFRERSPVTDFKSVKNEVELKGMRDAQVVDCTAMVGFLKWLEEEVQKGGVTEISAASKVGELRSKGDMFVGLSFETISGYGPHGAIVHYAVTEESDIKLEPHGIYLVDSGGQYLNGTTDITRTITLGDPTPEQKEMFTRVLKGHIGLASLRFPKGFTGKQIELPARKHLWDAGKNYSHGTGHGVGHYLNVHEGPMGITPRDIGVPLEAGNVLSNEPGYYKAGEYGIRIENMVVVVEDEEFSTEELTFLRFETITPCPIDIELVERSIMTDDEVNWLNDYHGMVYERLSPHLDDETREWLKVKTRAI